MKQKRNSYEMKSSPREFYLTDFLFKLREKLQEPYMVLIMLLIYLSTPNNMWSQQVGDNPSGNNVNYNDFFVKNIEEPNASTFKEVKLSAANPYVGSANISIPLYVIKDGDISVPISLSYLSTGVKANSVASNVGLNWTLNAGGMVNKVVEGFEDFGVEFRNPLRKPFDNDPDDDCNVIPSFCNYRKLKYDDFERPADLINTIGDGSIGLKSLGWFLGDEPLDIKDFLGYTSNYLDKILTVEELNRYKIKQDVYPDFFFVNAPGLSTTFTHRKDKTAFEIENSGNKIKTTIGKSNVINFLPKFHDESYFHTIQTFYGSKPRPLTCINNIEITNTSGTKYSFKELDVNQYITRNSFGPFQYGSSISAHLSSQEVSAYHLNSIKDANGREVTFEYEKYTLQSFSPSSSSSHNLGRDEKFRLTNASITEVYYPQLNRLTKINFSNGSVEFKYNLNRRDNQGDKALTGIIIRDKQNKIVKAFSLKYNYFSSNTDCNEPYCLRLKLTSVREYDATNNSLPPYLFFYDETKLPEVGTHNIDYLGYANSTEYTSYRQLTGYVSNIYYSYDKGRLSFSPVKIFSDSYELAKNARSLAPNLKYSMAGTLNRIKEPTGAEKYFTYELNTFSTPTVKNITAAGLRLKQQLIKDEKGHTKLLENYTYENEDGSSSGFLNNLPTYGDVSVSKAYRTNPEVYNIKYGITSGHLNFRTYSSPKNKLKLVQGNNIGYARVVIKNGINNGVIERNYHTAKEYPIEEPKLYRASFNGQALEEITDTYSDYKLVDSYKNGGHFPHYNNKDILLGKMWLERVFDADNELVSQKEIQYQYDVLEEMQQNVELYRSQLVITPELEGDYPILIQPKIFSHRNLQSVVKDKTIYPNENIEQVGQFTYHNTFPFVKESKMIFNDDQSITTKNYYPFEISTANTLGDTPLTGYEMEAIASLNNDHQINSPIQTESYRNDQLIGLQRTNFGVFHNNHILPKSIASAKGVRPLEEQVEFTAYDTAGNLEEASRVNGSKIRYVWGYQREYIIAKIEGYTNELTTEQIDLMNNASSVSNQDNDRTVDFVGKEGTLRQALHQIRQAFITANVTTSTYDPLIGITSITNPRGETVYYEYDNFNRLEFIEDQNNNVITQYCYNYKGERKKCNYDKDNNIDVRITINIGEFKEYMIPSPVRENYVEEGFYPVKENTFPWYTWPEINDINTGPPDLLPKYSMHPMFYRTNVIGYYHNPDDFNPDPVSELNTSFYTLNDRFVGARGYIKTFRNGYAFAINDLDKLAECDATRRAVGRTVATNCTNSDNAIENLILKWHILVDGEKYPLHIAPEIKTVFFVPRCLDNKIGKVVCEIYRKNDTDQSNPYRKVESDEMIFSAGFEPLDNNGSDNCGASAFTPPTFLLNN
ncbi:hypothetical protein [uncultured Aquimarina sp.]|uniref:hypothetical protein n=1 Tax=uncultured Aquimarina sp. TaxID=575652 RepID=UPI00261A4205|nr:hypothetical protein [uncultured Aquimarina sp.]